MTPSNAFLPGFRVSVPGAAEGPLAGLGFAVKDLIDVAGVPTGGGNPDWPRFAATPARHAGVVQALLDAGASVVGKTITDEVSLGILGENAHDGTPLNPAAPGRVPGGSSSGSASAVAAGECDFALGTDSGGSVRVPASFCGLYGIRPTHGRIDFSGITVQAPSADTCGWFARDAAIFARVGEVLCGATLPGGAADDAAGGDGRVRVRRRGRGAGAGAGGGAAGRPDRQPAGRGAGAAGAVGVATGAARAAGQRGVEDVRALARQLQSAAGVQRGARAGAGRHADGRGAQRRRR